MQITPSPRLVFGVLILVQTLFGINYVVSKIIVAAFPPLVWASVRSVLTMLLIGLLVDVRGQPHPKGGWRGFYLPVIGFALIGIIINQASFLVGLYYTTSTNSAVLNTLIPIFTLAIVIVRGQERLTPAKLLGFASSFTGVLILLRVEEFRLSDTTLIGDLLTMVNSLSYGFYLAYSGKFLAKHDRPWVTFWMFAVGSLGLTLLSLPSWQAFEWPRMTLRLWACTGYAVLAGTFLTYLLNNWILAFAESSRVALFIYLQPVIATVVAWWWFGERLTGRTFAGSLFIFLGVYLATFRRAGSSGAMRPAAEAPPSAGRSRHALGSGHFSRLPADRPRSDG